MPGDPATTPAPDSAPDRGEEHLVRHRRRRRHHFRPESEALARRRQDLRALAWILPGCLLALGAVVLLAQMRNPEPAARARDVVAIGVALVGAGAVWLGLDIACRWIAVVREWRRGADNDSFRPRHRHHRRDRRTP